MSIEEKATTAIDQTLAQPNEAAVSAALAVLDRFMAALNAGNEPALLPTLHFPHYRLSAGKIRIGDQPGAYLGDFLRSCRPGLAPQRMGFLQGYRGRRHRGPLGRAIHPLSRRQTR